MAVVMVDCLAEIQINEGVNLNILCLQAFNLMPKMGRPHSATRSSIAVARKIVVFVNKRN